MGVIHMLKTSVTALLEQMTLEEKIAQLMQITPNFLTDNKADLTGPMEWMGLTEESVSNVGSVLSAVGAKDVIELQKKYMAGNRSAFRCCSWLTSFTDTGRSSR